MKYVKTLLVVVVSLLSAYTGTASAADNYYTESFKLYNYVTPLIRDKTAALELVGDPVIQAKGGAYKTTTWFGKSLVKVMEPGHMGNFIINHSVNDGSYAKDGYDNAFTLVFSYAVQQDTSKTCTIEVTGGSYRGDGERYAVKKETKVKVVSHTGLPCIVLGSDQQGYTIGLGPVIIK